MVNARRFQAIIAILLGIVAGLGLGYAGATGQVLLGMPLLRLNSSKAVGFDQEFDDFSRLAAMEYVAACGDRKSALRALDRETEILHGFQQPDGSYLSPITRVAAARAISRKAKIKEEERSSQPQPHPPPNDSGAVENLLKSAGWLNPSASHMREVIQQLDDELCRK